MRSAGLLLLLLLLAAPAASAHAVLRSADPPPNGHADEGLMVVVFIFTEDVEREYTSADVVDLNGESWAAGPPEFDEEERNVLRLPVRPLPSGLYSASWKALSVDTHTTRGAFVFAVGDATLRPGQYEPIVDVPDPGSVARDGAARFAFYVGLFLAAGIPLFALAVLREAPPRRLLVTAAAFGALGALGALVGLLLLGQRTGLGLGAVDSAPGRSFAWRGATLALAALAAGIAAAQPRAWRAWSLAALATGVAAIVATSLGSHAASAKEFTTLLLGADMLHLAMGAVWVGGVVAFLLAAPGRDSAGVAALIVRFSPWAVASVLLLLATGFAASAAHIPCVAKGIGACGDALRSEPYTRLVALKLLLMVPLIAIGAYNQMRAGPRLARGEHEPRVFRRVLAVEAVTMSIVLVAAGVLAASPPPADAEAAPAEIVPAYFEVANVTGKSHVILQVSPNPVTVGVQTLIVTVHPLGGTLPNSTQVALKIWHEDEREPDVTIDPTKVTPAEWELEDGLFTRAGTWNVLIILQRPDEYAKLEFQVPVVNPGGTSS